MTYEPSSEKYNGWTNWDTWATGLWADNDEKMNNQKAAILRAANKYEKRGKYNEMRLRAGLIRFYKKAALIGRKNGDEINNKKVNWKELADAAIKERKDYE